VILRIRPSRIGVRKVRVLRSTSGADVALALILNTFFVTLGVVSFTMFCWLVLADLGELRAFPLAQGFLSQREPWLMMAVLSSVFAVLIGSFVELLKSMPQEADELRAESLRTFVTASER
jgi:hypothetical protein